MPDWPEAVRARLLRDGVPAPPRDVVEEVAQHIADVHRNALLQGRSDTEIEQLIAAEFANIREVAHAIVRRRGGDQTAAGLASPHWLAGLSGDAFYAARLLISQRAYSSVVVLTLAIGIGSCTAVFSLFNALLLGPLPYPEPSRLVLLWETDAGDRNAQFIVAAPNYLDWSRDTRSFSALGIWESLTFNLAAGSDPEQVPGIRGSSSLFHVLGVLPALGRVYTPQEDAAGNKVAVISDAVWRLHFSSDPQVVGRPIRLNGNVYDVIGVMPRGFDFPRAGTGVWVPIAFTQQDQERGAHSFFVAGRLRDGVTYEQARDEVERTGESLRRTYEENSDEGATVQRMEEFGVGNVRQILIALSGAVTLVLLIACVNVASLQLAFGLTRRREFVTRLAMGATYRHLARQVFLEGVLVALVGGAVGTTLAWAAVRSADIILSPGFRSLPFRGDVAVTLDSRALLFAIAASLTSALLFAFAPLVGLHRPALQPMLREGDRGATRFAGGTRRALVAAEIALAVVVLSGAGLMIRSLTTLLAVQPGLDPRNVLTLQVSLPQPDTYGAPERATFCTDLAREVGSLPGVVRASAISHLPLSGANAGRSFTIEGRPQPQPTAVASANYRVICPDYFATLGIRVVTGREFLASDTRDGAQVVIVNRSVVSRYWPDGKALGQRIKIGGSESANPWMTVVGVVDDVRHFGLESEARREIFRPYSQAVWPVMTVVAKTSGDPLAWQRSVRDALRRVELDLPAANARTMETVIAQSVAWRETPMRLLTGFALVGLLLAGIGVYSVLAYYVSQRTRELGVRVALGASKRDVVGLVFRQTAVPLAAGIALGIAGSIGAGRLLAELLYEVKPGDPVVLVTITTILIVAAIVASWIPARRAAMVDPLVALREE
jgi:putative ABC transport system permease protein